MVVAKLVEQRFHNIPGMSKIQTSNITCTLHESSLELFLGKLRTAELFFDVPLDYSKPDRGTIRIFCRSAERHERPAVTDAKEKKQLPWLTYLQGGPGFPCRPPQDSPWINMALDRGYKVIGPL